MKQGIIALALLCIASYGLGQDSLKTPGDTTIYYKNQVFTLTDVVVRNNLNVAAFIDYVKNDTTFFKAFRNLRILNFSSYNQVIFKDKNGATQASLLSQTEQKYLNGCRTMNVVQEQVTGDLYKKDGSYNYTTADMYASLFFTRGKVCGENNIVAGRAFSAKGKSGMQRHKEQLKQLFFNPGTKIDGLPFIGNRVALFDDDVAALYDFKIDRQEHLNRTCYVFTITPKANLRSGEKKDIVINEMTTWFDAKTLDIIARNYRLSYNAAIFSFDVAMQVELEKFNDLLVPRVLRYNGNWKILFKKAERAIFTATLFGFRQ